MFVLLVLISYLINIVTATSNGAGNCLDTDTQWDDFRSSHGDAAYAGTGDTSIQTSSDSFQPGCTYTISVCSGTAQYNGFLLTSRDMDAPFDHLGHFTDPSTIANSNAKLMSCSYADSSVTHSMPVARASQHFKWTAPTAAGVDAVHLSLLTVRSTQSDWYFIEKMVMIADTGAACPTPPDANVCPGQGMSLSGEDMSSMSGMSGMHGMSGMDMGGMDMNNMGSMNMVMNTKFQTNAWSGINIVFPTWVLNSNLAYVGTLIAIFCMAFFAEWLQVISAKMDRIFVARNINAHLHAIKVQSVAASSGVIPLQVTVVPATSTATSPSSASFTNSVSFDHWQQLVRSLLHVLRSFLSLFLMIVFMILDVGICVALLCGYGLGFFLFSPRDRPLDSTSTADACH